ncbi:26S proteasome non-ATPase regulatory subunit 5 isoform X1 [Podarcis raffonei]|uniref:26S proteasome non-ATPase regulatory subunit 5 isoform X1 n=2 Tax=Podarcis raffonei TaxID=65483 RepID=UPI00232941E0|nr:26S proteasome non-ATPase regulatory subunit 5 isoform X1 [Podarcis raffonei]
MAAPEVDEALELLARVPLLEEPLEELRALHLALLAVPLNALRERRSELPLAGLFALTARGGSEQISLCVSILERLLQIMDPLYVIQNFGEELQKGLFHPDNSVKILTIAQVGKIVEDSSAAREILNTPELLRQVIYCIADEKLAVAKEAIMSLTKVAKTAESLEALLAGNLLVDLKNVMTRSDIVRCRVYELVINISLVSADSLNYCVNSGLISELIGELTGNDVLLRATCIEMVTSLAHIYHGRQYLAQQGIIDKISNIIIGADSDPFSSFYLPGFVKFFGNLAIVDSPQQLCERYPAFVEKVFSMAESQDPTMFGVAVDTLGILGSTVEGKLVLQKKGSRFHHVLNRIGHQAKNAPTEMRVRCLEAISSLLYLQPDQQTEDHLGMTESWFSSLSSQPLELFRSISTQPFPDLHCGALKVFTAIASQPWAQRMMLSSPGFVEYIVDRSVEPDKPSKEAKYELVKALANSKTIAEIFGNQHYLRLRAYLREGPYYVKAVSTTAVEGAE